ncbi:MAG: flagellar motor protein MotB [Lachnospiraceae bacterium]|nr:flagellar motor protein MotB [Lachnospiraceae bacterium]MBR3684496.1 flagellar motor protein MotB [Lachnospiraceae bacterium]
MAKKKQEDIPLGSPAWMATFSDLMNLLLCFFVLLFSMSTVDAEKWEKVVASFNNTFSIWDAGASAIGDGLLISNGVSQLNELKDYINSTGVAEDAEDESDNIVVEDSQTGGELSEKDAHEILGEIEEMQIGESEQMYESIEEMLYESNLDKEIDIDFTSQYVQLSLKGAFLFDSGKAELKKESFETLNLVARILETYPDSMIEIEGHTDNQPLINHSKYEDNDALSDARAREVFHYLVDNSLLDPAKLKHAGRGEYDPVADNSTAEGRQKNRRVEIKIYNSLSSY